MLILRLILSVVLLTNAFALGAALNRSLLHAAPRRSVVDGALVQRPAPGPPSFDSRYKLSLPHPVQDKNFYLLSLLQRDRKARKLLNQDEVLKSLAHQKVTALTKATSCDSAACFEELTRLDEREVEAVTTEFAGLASKPEFKRLANDDMRRSGVFIRYDDRSDSEMLAAAWQDAARGLNRILSVYCLGKDPHFKDIDRVSYDVSTAGYRDLLKAKIAQLKLAEDPLFFEPTLQFALGLLEVNRRDEAGRYEPLEEGENKAAVKALKHIRWRDYPYSFILVLGSGPGGSARLSPIGAKRADAGAQLYLEHKAPLLILSGGHVHPMQTPYCEAVEMKKYVMEKYKIPEAAILIDPHARHTTTNIRNAARLAFRYRIPTASALVTSSENHITSTVADEFRSRCLRELGYLPFESIKRISPVAAEFSPSVASLFFDANDPLDP